MTQTANKRLWFILIILLTTFLFAVSFNSVANPDKKIEETISILKKARNKLKNGNKQEAFNILCEAKNSVTEAMFPLLDTNNKNTFKTDRWLIKFGKPKATDESSFADYYISLKMTIENLSNKDLEPCFHQYLIDPDGLQRSGVTLSPLVLAGATTKDVFFGESIKESEFVYGTYTLILRNHCDIAPNKKKQFEFTLDLTKEYFEEN